MLKVMNQHGDHHVHTFNFSDGMNTVDEMVVQAGKIGLKEIAFTDHSQHVLGTKGYIKKSERAIIRRWKNVHNDVRVIFGVEADIVNSDGDVCLDIQGREQEFTILSAHWRFFKHDPTAITEAYLRAIDRFGDRIKFLSHPCLKQFEGHLDIERVALAAMERGIGFELDCTNLMLAKTSIPNLLKMLRVIDRLWVNSDAHTLYELTESRKLGFAFLEQHGFRYELAEESV